MAFGLSTVPLFEDEHLPSFVSRLARANGRKTSVAFCREVGLEIKRLISGDPEEVTRLAELCRLPSERLRHHAITRSLRPKAVTFRNVEYEAGILSHNRLRFCPCCMQNDDAASERLPGTRRYARFTWLVAALRTCPTHNCRINSSERSCTQGFDQLNNVDFKGTRDLAAVVYQQVTSDFERFVHDRILGHRQHGDLLDSLTLGQAVRLCELFGIAITYGKHQSSRTLDDNERLAASNNGYQYLSAGENGLYMLLDIIRGGPTTRSVEGLMANYGNLYTSLARISSSHSFKTRILEMVRRHSLQTSLTQGVDDASERMADHSTGTFVQAVIERQACEIIGCSREMFRQLVEAGLLTAHVTQGSASTKASGAAKYELQCLLMFRQRLLGKTKPAARNVLKTQGMFSLQNAASRTGCNSSTIVRLILNGHLTEAARIDHGLLGSSIHVNVSELKRALAHDAGLSAEDVARRLHLGENDIDALVSIGIFSTRSYGSAQFKMFDEPEIDSFMDQYISMNEIRARMGKRGITWSDVRQLGLQREFGPPVHAAIFDRKRVRDFIDRRNATVCK